MSHPATVPLAIVVQEAMALRHELEAAPTGDSAQVMRRADLLVAAAVTCGRILGVGRQRVPDHGRKTVAVRPAPVGDAVVGLSAREREVLRLIAAGLRDREIAGVLGISLRTVTTHVTSILNKLGVESRVAAAACAVRRGLA